MRLFSSLVTICALLFVSSASAKRREAATTPGTAKGAKEGDDVASAHQQQKVLSTGDAGAFAPPAVFRNKEVVRSINLEKSYVRVNTRVTVKNIDHKKSPHGDYYVPFAAGELKRDVGGIEVREENAGDSGKLDFSVVSDKDDAEYLLVRLREPLKPSGETTLSISHNIVHALSPLPTAIGQDDTQFVVYKFPAYVPSAYATDHQKTKVKYPTPNIARYTITSGLKRGADPDVAGRVHTHGPYESIAPGTPCPTISAHYAFPKPIPVFSLLERDVEVSHFGGNLATEDRLWLENRAANLSRPFDRVKYTYAQLMNPPVAALRQLRFPLQAGSADAYFVDDIGNVSTSLFRPSSSLDIAPRYPLFGGWRYKFRVGWNNDLARFLRRSSSASSSDNYVLKIPFIQPPRLSEGIHYENINMRVILPEGATDIQYQLVGPKGLPYHVESSIGTYKTYLDTIGRSVLTLKTENVVDEARHTELIVSYKYTLLASLRKPMTLGAALLASLTGVVLLGRLDIGIKKR